MRHEERPGTKVKADQRDRNALLPAHALGTLLFGMAHTSTGVTSPTMIEIVSGLAHKNFTLV